MLTELADGLWVRRAPHTMLGLHIGTRMSVVRLPGGGLLVHSPIALTPELRRAVDALGPVTHITAPNLYHHVYVAPWKMAYPDATLSAVAGLERKRPELSIDRTLDATAHADWEGALVPHRIEGCKLGETLFVHPASRSVISVDLCENWPHHEHFVTRTYLKVSGVYGKVGWPRPLRILYTERRATRRSIDALLEHDFDRLVIAHGEVIETGAKDAIRQTFQGWIP